MTRAAAVAVCEATVRRTDPDRYLAALFAPAAKRPLLYALYAFNHELARVTEMARDPFAAEIRLQWWRDALVTAGEGRPPPHPVALGLAQILTAGCVEPSELEALVDARVIESSSAPFPTLSAMEIHAQATSARLMRLAACTIFGANGPAAIDHAGIAYGLTGILRSFRFHLLRSKVFLPADLLAAEGLSTADIASGRYPVKLRRVRDRVGACAMAHFQRTRENAVPEAVMSAVLPASLVPAYLSRIVKNGDPSRDAADISGLRRQLIMLRAALRRRL